MNDWVDDYLMHHGILGQKWGVRRFQNRDGSLTPRGKSRYKNSDGSLTNAGMKREQEIMTRARAMTDRDTSWRKGRSFDTDGGEKAYDKALMKNYKKAAKEWDQEDAIKEQEFNDYIDDVVKNSVGFDRIAAELAAEEYRNNPDYDRDQELFDITVMDYADKEKKSSLQRAKDTDLWQIDYLDGIQNDTRFMKGDKKWMLEEYERYLDDPLEWWRTRHERLIEE